MVRKRLAYHLPCPECGSSDALELKETYAKCYSCDYYDPHGGDEETIDRYLAGRKPNRNRRTESTMTQDTKYEDKIVGIPERKIHKDVAMKYGVITVFDGGKAIGHKYPYFNDKGEPCGYKARNLEQKKFWSDGDIQKGVLFGQHLFPKGGKHITITEGELDALAAYEMFGGKGAVVSIKGGAAAAEQSVSHSLEYLETFERIVLCFDDDEAGKEASIKVAGLFSPGKCFIFKHAEGMKDACDYKLAGNEELYVDRFWKAELWTPAGIIPSSQIRERIKNRKLQSSIPYPWKKLNELTYGIRKGEFVIITADTGVGKTQILREIEFGILQEDKEAKVGTLFLEEPPEDSGLGLMSIYANKPLHLPDVDVSDEEWEAAYKNTLEKDRVFFYDSFGESDIDAICRRVRFYAKALGCDYIILDHLSFVGSDHAKGDERKRLDDVSERLKKLTIELDIALLTVIHTNREGMIRGSSGPEKVANMIIHINRDKLNPDPVIRNTTEFTVWKNRFCGRTGPAGQVFYNEETGRLEEQHAYVPIPTSPMTQAGTHHGQQPNSMGFDEL